MKPDKKMSRQELDVVIYLTAEPAIAEIVLDTTVGETLCLEVGKLDESAISYRNPHCKIKIKIDRYSVKSIFNYFQRSQRWCHG